MEAKRLKLGAEPSSQSRAGSQLADVLQRLQSLLRAGGEPDGLDSLLEELAMAQTGLNGYSGAAQDAVRAIADAQEKLQAAIVVLQAAVDRFTPPPGYQPPAAGADKAFVRGLLSYAHRLSYSSAAPLGHQPGQPLYFFKPPAPQEAEMRVSQLHTFNREWEERQQALEAQRQAASRGAAAPAAAAAAVPLPAAAPAAATPAGGDMAAVAARLGVDVRQLLASMPAGWKPGDPIPAAGGPAAALQPAPAAPSAAATEVPAAASAEEAQQSVEAATEAAAAAVAAAAAAAGEEAEAAPAPRLAGIFLNQLNFAELEYGVSSGDEDDSDSDADSD